MPEATPPVLAAKEDEPPPREERRSTGLLRTVLFYGAMIVLAAAAFESIRRAGGTLVAPPPTAERFDGGGPASSHSVLLHVLIALSVVIVVSRALGAVFKLIHQPPVIGEVVAGILLGPSLFGRIAPNASAYLMPPTIAPYLGVLAQVGVILYMFLVGLDLDTASIRARAHSSVAVSHASIVFPFVLGGLLALGLYPILSSSDVPFTVFALFMGVAMSVTAFPVLARILTDRGMHRTRLGSIALACAAVDDVTAWCLLAFVVGVVRSRVGGAVLTVVLSSVYLIAMWFAVRPLVARAFARRARDEGAPPAVMAAVFIGLLASALITEAIGIHAVFGAFLLGVVLPRDGVLAAAIRTRLHDVVVLLLLPAFFAFTGMRTQIGLVDGAFHWLLCGAIIFVASLGKFGGTLVAAKLSGFGWRDAAALGTLMNTRGLMELIVLNIGLELRVISPTLFAMLVIMAVVTTMATTPLLQLIIRGRELAPQSTA